MRTIGQASGPRRIASRAAALAAALFLAWGCCVGATIKLSRVADFLSGVIEISGSASVEVSSSFDGDFAGWADIPAFSEDELDVDLSGAAYYEGSESFDVDYDAANEQVALLRAVAPAAPGAPMIFAAWSGDKYTIDGGVCYVGWVGDAEAHLAASWCGDGGGVMVCSMPIASSTASCDLCEGSSPCTPCDPGGRLEDCLPAEPTGGSVDLDVDIDIDIDIDIDVGDDTGGAP
jgi:hypothetical protein